MKGTTPVLITTSFRGVFFGYLPEGAKIGEVLTIKNARNCVYWGIGIRGFLGLAESGPSNKCRVGPKVPELTLTGVTSVAQCTDDAVARWEAGPWS